MDKTSADEAMKELTMLLMYLSRFSKKDRLSGGEDFYAWKGYDFDTINGLDDKDFIRQGKHPSRIKFVYLTDTGINYAKKLMEKYNIEDCC
ncbi:MAG: DUF6429 family protein [Acutalibacteraceae bacterium]